MRRKDKEITNKAEIEAILKKAFICHLGLSDGDQPYVVPMNYGMKTATSTCTAPQRKKAGHNKKEQ